MGESKFWIIQEFEKILLNYGFSQPLTDLITFASACALLAVLVWLIDFIGTRIALIYIKRGTEKTKTNWDDLLYKRRFFHRVIRLIPAIAILFFIDVIFKGYNASIVSWTYIGMQCVLIFMVITTICSFLDAANDVYDSKDREKSIKGFIQIAKISIYIIGIILIISLLSRESPRDLFVGLGASAAIVTLVFKDTILGFISGIQLSAQDMVRRGDWIEVPSKNADGIVTDITLSTVKVLNWNNTLTMVPVYSMVTEPFTNWRSMQESSGRRFMRQLYIDISTIKILSDNEIETIKANQYIAPYADGMISSLTETNTSPFSTNIGLYRCYIEAFVRKHPKTNEKLPLSVKYLPQTDNGVRIEIYAFSAAKDLANFEKTISDIFENIMALAPIFGVGLYQRPSDSSTKKS